MEMGTGKTRVGVELMSSAPIDFILYLVPNSLRSSTEGEIKKWNNSNQEYLIVAYETIQSSDRKYLQLLQLLKDKKAGVIADESIFIKNSDTKRYNRILELTKNMEYRLILSGTPIAKDEYDLYNQMYFLSPKIINMSVDEFRHTFFTKVKFKRRGENSKEFYKLSDVNLSYLHKLVSPFIFNAEFIFDKEERVTYLPLGTSLESRVYYEKLKEDVLKKIENNESFLDTLVNMQVLTFTDEERIKEMATHIKGKSIVFCCFLNEVEILSKKLKSYVITGATPLEERTRILEQFKQSDIPLIMTFGTGAFGLNLQHCSKIYFSSISFDYSKTLQAKARIRRIGQMNDIEYIYFTSDLGIYSLIEHCLDKKEILNELMIEKVKELI